MTPLSRALLSLDGLALGDAFGQCCFQPGKAHAERLRHLRLPPAPWHYTDDTEMALSVVAVLARHGCIDQAQLAGSFAEHYSYDRAALDDYQEALWLVACAGGDRDMLCAIVGGVVACHVGPTGLPERWKARREALPDWHVPP